MRAIWENVDITFYYSLVPDVKECLPYFCSKCTLLYSPDSELILLLLLP